MTNPVILMHVGIISLCIASTYILAKGVSRVLNEKIAVVWMNE